MCLSICILMAVVFLQLLILVEKLKLPVTAHLDQMCIILVQIILWIMQ